VAKTQFSCRGLQADDLWQSAEELYPLIADLTSTLRMRDMSHLVSQQPTVVVACDGMNSGAFQRSPALFKAPSPIRDIASTHDDVHGLLLQPIQRLPQATMFTMNIAYDANFLNHCFS
jgi:hypothetical protein